MIDDGKTCEGCVYYIVENDDCKYEGPSSRPTADDPNGPSYIGWGGGGYCKHWQPSLEYRRTVALERLASAVTEDMYGKYLRMKD